jgi:hypothetical protein
MVVTTSQTLQERNLKHPQLQELYTTRVYIYTLTLNITIIPRRKKKRDRSAFATIESETTLLSGSNSVRHAQSGKIILNPFLAALHRRGSE